MRVAGRAPVRRRRRTARALPALGLALLAACASLRESELERSWKREWNERVDTAASRWENPCGDPRFDPWVDAFLEGCVPAERLPPVECERRRLWVQARVDQCRIWQDWLARNHGRRARDDDAPEPTTRVD